MRSVFNSCNGPLYIILLEMLEEEKMAIASYIQQTSESFINHGVEI